MIIRKILPEEKELYNSAVEHPLQAWEWGEFKGQTGMNVVRLGVFEKDKIVAGFQILLKKLPKTPYFVGQCLRGPIVDEEAIAALKELAEEERAVFIKLEPDVIVKKWKNFKGEVTTDPYFLKDVNLDEIGLRRAKRPLFDQHSFVLDITKSEEELLANMHPKTRYNVRLAEKNGVVVSEKSDEEGLQIFLDLFLKTQKRQGFYMHDPSYFKKMWLTLAAVGIAHILLAKHQGKILTAHMVFVWKDKIYYPYGASSSEMRNLMSSNLMYWEMIRFGKKMGCKTFDLWGCLGPNPDPKNSWFGFHRIKAGYGSDLVEFCGSWDLIANYPLYSLITTADSVRWKLLRLKRKLHL